jgi:1-acyl-sn-glycerol-3-phosphate acyltransferase
VIAFLRRMLLAGAMLALAVLALVGLPVTLIVAAGLSPLVPGYLRPLRVLWIALLHIFLEAVMILLMLDLWVFSGFGWALRRPFFQRAHYSLVRWYLVIMFREASRVLHLTVALEGEAPNQGAPGPVLVLSRHAGPGDSFTVMYALQQWYGREPRVVLKNTMALDPAIGLVLHRLPARFISPQPGSQEARDEVEAQIADLATGLDDNDAFVIFPEGGNFTKARRERAIASLRRLGLTAMAERAERMTSVIAPRPGGVLTALDAAPDADVMLVAHTGLDHLDTVSDIWRELPMDKQIVMRWWRVPRSEVPSGREERIDWLFTWWEQIDTWIEQNRPVEPEGGRVVPPGS